MLSKAFTTRQVAELAHVSQSTIANWISSGKLSAFRTPGGHHRILPTEFMRFLESHGFPIPEELQEAQLKILVIDETQAGVALAETLRGANFEVITADTGAEGLLRIGLELPDVVIWDSGLTDLRGVDICRQVQLNPSTNHIRFIQLISNKAVPLPNVYRSLSKPVDVVILAQALRDLQKKSK
jgi:excisionase family DNA binding protein